MSASSRPPARRRRRTALALLAVAWLAAGVTAATVDSGPESHCPLSEPGSRVGLRLSGCELLGSDTGAGAAIDFWGQVDCADLSRHRRVPRGGDPHRTALGAPQHGRGFRRLTVLDGDDVFGERCELGANVRDGPTAFYREGDRVATFVSLRLPPDFPLDDVAWQTVTQMKQTQPSDAGDGIPVLDLQARDSYWQVSSDRRVYWRFPIRRGVWTRFVFDVTYSTSRDRGLLQVSADLDGDGDVRDPGERTPVIRTATLKPETAGSTADGLAAGASIPSHLRAGVYHDPAVPCPPPLGCRIDVDNVQVVGA